LAVVRLNKSLWQTLKADTELEYRKVLNQVQGGLRLTPCLIGEASMLLSEHVAFYPRLANVDWGKGWAESLQVLAVG